MKRLVSICAITAMACAGTLPALAQSDTSKSGESSTAAQHQNMKNASDVTCAEVSQLDMMLVPGVLYFVAGHEHAKSKADGTHEMNAPKAKSEAGKTEAKAETATKDGKKTATAGADAKKHEAPVEGFYAIPVEEIMIACEKTPERKASEVMKEHHSSKVEKGTKAEKKTETKNETKK